MRNIYSDNQRKGRRVVRDRRPLPAQALPRLCLPRLRPDGRRAAPRLGPRRRGAQQARRGQQRGAAAAEPRRAVDARRVVRRRAGETRRCERGRAGRVWREGEKRGQRYERNLCSRRLDSSTNTCTPTTTNSTQHNNKTALRRERLRGAQGDGVAVGRALTTARAWGDRDDNAVKTETQTLFGGSKGPLLGGGTAPLWCRRQGQVRARALEAAVLRVTSCQRSIDDRGVREPVECERAFAVS